MKKLKRFEIGNIYSIETRKGLGLFQLVNIPEDKRMDVEMIRVSYHLYAQIPEDLEGIFVKDFFYVRFPVKAALRRKLIDLAGYVDLEKEFAIPDFFREVDFFNTDHWIISNIKDNTFKQVETLTPEELLYSPEGVWNDTYLKERLEEGWRLEKWT